MARRREIIALVGDEQTLRERATNYLPDGREQAFLDELEDRDYMLAL